MKDFIMKDFEELERMKMPQLKAIAKDLSIDISKKMKKPELVRLIYDIQQPDKVQEKDIEPRELQDKDITTNKEYEARKKEILNYFEAEKLEEVGETPEGVVIFAVLNQNDEEITRGIFIDLEEKMTIGSPLNEGNEAKIIKDDLNIYEQPNIAEPILTSPPLKDESVLEKVKEGLEPLKNFGLKYTIEDSVIVFTKGSKRITSTLNQPAYRTVRIAEILCKRT